MAQQRSAAEHSQARPRSNGEAGEREHRVQIEGQSSVTQSIAHSVVIKDGDLFFLCDPDGDVPEGQTHGLGLYYHDCRFLDEYTLRFGSVQLEPLVATAERGFEAILQLTNPDLRLSDGRLIRKQTIGVKWKRTLDGAERALQDLVTVQNFGTEPIHLPVVLTFGSAFEPVFVVRGLPADNRGRLHRPVWHDESLHLSYEGLDQVDRSLDVHFSQRPTAMQGTRATFEIEVKPLSDESLLVSILVGEARHTATTRVRSRAISHLTRSETVAQARSNGFLAEETSINSDSPRLNGLVQRSLRDLQTLETRIGDRRFFAAGVPWFVALFGRGSLIAALQALAFDPAIAADTLRLLARYQGQRVDSWGDEEPGKIMHELRVGELAGINAVPQTPYYGTVDATPLFLILLGRHAAWTGELTLFDELRTHVERALNWISEYGDSNEDGYLDYRSASKKGLANQGWKDSGDAITNDDGSLATPPIALVEVQGYCYLAQTLIGDLYSRAGDHAQGERLHREAEGLRVRFNEDFWLDDKQFYALALQHGARPAAVIASNPGQAMWTGIVDPAKAPPVIDRLMADDMFNGWGIRTLSTHERRYNPVGYHVGTVWPHDNAFIASGFRRYGADAEACRLVEGIVDAATHFEHQRLPETFAGFSRLEYDVPVRYPVACHPQAWASGSIPFALEALLGLTPDGFAQQLRIVRPVLPTFVDRLAIARLRVGRARVDLLFERKSDGATHAEVTNREGQLDVLIEH